MSHHHGAARQHLGAASPFHEKIGRVRGRSAEAVMALLLTEMLETRGRR